MIQKVQMLFLRHIAKAVAVGGTSSVVPSSSSVFSEAALV